MDKKIAKEVLLEALKTGADYAEIFFENTYKGSINYLSRHVESIDNEELYGVGLRLLIDDLETYGYTNDVTKDGLFKLAQKVRSGFDQEQKIFDFEFVMENKKDIVDIKRRSKDVSYKEKIPYLKEVSEAIYAYSPLITQAKVCLEERTQEVSIFTSEGKYIKDLRNTQRINATAYASDGVKSQSIRQSVGGNYDIDEFKNKDLTAFGRELAKSCVTMLNAKDMVGGVYPVVIHNGFGGVLFHEACGHSLEATSVAKGLSVFSGKLGEKIASDIVTAVDDGTLRGEWGSLNYDDEGHETRKNVLIENGILKGYMIDKKNGRTMGSLPTGSSRRENYKYSPTSRMTNTYIANGTSTFEDIIKSTKYGLFAKSLGGGSVNPLTGEFNFAVNEGYLIEDGKISIPVRGATLIGNGANALKNIDMISNNMTFGHGVCGSLSGSICANVGEPTIRILNMTVGGNGGNR